MAQDIAQKNPTAVSLPRDYSRSQLQLIKRTVAKDCNDNEFDMFIEICKRQGLDPFRRQIYAFVFNKDNEKKRQFVTVTGIDGYRAMAKRTGTYRPAEQEPEIEYDEAKVDPDTNPKGIVKATVIIHQFGPDKQWHPVVGIARWEEFAPLGYGDGAWDSYDTGEVYEDSGRKKYAKRLKPGAKKSLSKENWVNMPHVMIAKCAEAQALRKGWPEEVGGLFTFDEMDRVVLDMTASDEVRQYEEDERLTKVGANDSVPLIFNFMAGIEFIPVGEVADKILAHAKSLETSTEVEMWRDANRAGLQMYWAKHKSEALEVKSALEKIIKGKPAFKEPIEQEPVNA